MFELKTWLKEQGLSARELAELLEAPRKTVDYPDQLAHGFHVTLDDGTWVTVRRDQVK